MAEEDKLNRELKKLAEQEQVSDAAMQETMTDVRTVTELLMALSSGYEFAKPHEQDRIARIIITELFVSQNSVKTSPQMAFEPFFDKKNAVCEPTAWLTELCLGDFGLRSVAERLQSVV